MVLDSENYLLRYVSNLNISRRKNSSKAIPEVQNIRIFYCFGDIDSIIMFCNTVYPSFVCNKNTYNIFITWNGLEFLNEHADEVWSFNDEKIVDMFYKKTNGIDNTSDGIYSLTRSLNENFFHVEGPQKYSKYFKTHLKQEYFDAVKTISFKFPALQSQSVINDYVINRMTGESNKVCMFSHSMTCNICKYGID